MKNLIQHSSYQRQSFYGAFNRISKVSEATDEPSKANTCFGMILGIWVFKDNHWRPATLRYVRQAALFIFRKIVFHVSICPPNFSHVPTCIVCRTFHNSLGSFLRTWHGFFPYYFVLCVSFGLAWCGRITSRQQKMMWKWHVNVVTAAALVCSGRRPLLSRHPAVGPGWVRYNIAGEQPSRHRLLLLAKCSHRMICVNEFSFTATKSCVLCVLWICA